MTLLNIGLRRYTLPPTQGWRQGGAIKNRFWGWAIQDWGRPNAVWRHRQPPLHHLRPCRPVQASNSLISQLASRVAAVRSTPPRRESTLGAESRLCCHHMRLQLPPPHRDAIFEHPSGLARHSPWHCLFALEPRIDARPQDVPNLIYEPRSAMLDAWMGVAGSPCDRNVLTTLTAASQTRDAGGNQAIMNRPPLRMARLERDMARIGNRHAQSSACSDPSCPRSPGPSPPAEPAQRASEVSVRRTDVNASNRRLAPEHRPTALPLCAPRMNH